MLRSLLSGDGAVTGALDGVAVMDGVVPIMGAFMADVGAGAMAVDTGANQLGFKLPHLDSTFSCIT